MWEHPDGDTVRLPVMDVDAAVLLVEVEACRGDAALGVADLVLVKGGDGAAREGSVGMAVGVEETALEGCRCVIDVTAGGCVQRHGIVRCLVHVLENIALASMGPLSAGSE